MISLFLIASHMFGDFIAQNDYMASNKFTNKKVLLLHCLCYTLCFLPCVYVYQATWLQSGFFLLNLFISHVIIDRQPLVKNHPWPLKQLFVDQTVHICVLVLLAFLFLRV